MIDALFGSKTRVKLLRLFFNNPDNAYYVRELTREIDEQINSIRRELKNLQDIGVVNVKAVKNQLYYGVNKDFVFYKPFAQIFTGKTVKNGKKDDKAKEFKELGEIKLVIQAGKFVGNPDQGIDLLIVGDNISKIRLKTLIQKLEEISGEINYSVMHWEEFYYRRSVKDKFILDILDNKHTILIDTENIIKEEE